MDECENLVINLEDFEELELQLKQQQLHEEKARQQLLSLEDTDDEEEEEEEEEAAEEGVADVVELNENANVIELELTAAEFESEIMGQSESKKLFKKNVGGSGGGGNGVLETKGTAMSFGFRKKLNTTPKKTKKQKEYDSGKKQDKCNNLSADSDGVSSMVDEMRTRCGVGRAGTVIDTQSMESFVETNDNNGNTEQMSNIHFEKVGAAVAAKTAQSHNQGASLMGEQQQQQHRPGAGNRFGFKGNSIVRPASTGITPRYQSGEELLQANLENNNTDNAGGPNKNLPYKSNLKRRSKSAHSARSMTSNQCGDAEFENVGSTDKQTAGAPKIAQPKTITFNLNHNTIEYQRRQFFEQTPPTSAATTSTSSASTTAHYNIINTGRHTNVIVRPLPKPAPVPAAFTKFTLQTTSLPKPEYPVAIRLTTLHAATTSMPLTVATAYPVVAHATGARAKDSQVEHMDQKTAKQMANNTRRGFNGSREISADSGIASLDITLAGDSSTSSGGGGGGGVGSTRHSSPKRSRSRPRNLQMVMSGRHKFEVRDLDDPLSSESSLVEPLALPKLPSEHQTVPLTLSGLVRSNTVLSREAFMQSSSASAKVAEGGDGDEATRAKRDECDAIKPTTAALRENFMKQTSDDTDSIEEEKLHIDRSTSEKNVKKHHQFRDINTYSSKNSSATSSRASSWCNAGESLAIKDCSSLSISSSEDSNKLEQKYQLKYEQQEHLADSLNDDDISTILNTDMQISSISSLTESLPAACNKVDNIENNHDESKLLVQLNQRPGIATPLELSHERPQSLYSSLNESKFAEIAAAGSEYLLDDETSPTDSLVSSTDSDDAACKRQKHKTNEEIQEKDIDEISPELDLGSPISPGTPTHASHSLSLSDCGNLIDDEIADQPALLFNNDGGCGEHSGASHKGHSDTPTLMETAGGSSMLSLKSQSKARTALQQAIELSLRIPMSLRQAVLNRAESLDTLSPCESICSDDLMMDFDVNSSMDSIDKSTSIKSRSGSDLNKLDEVHLFGELDRKGSDVMKELNTILRVHTRNPDKEGITAHLPARATRLLNRSRLQQQCQLSNADSSESPKSSNHSVHHQHHRRSVTSRTSTSTSSLHHSGRDTHSSSDDLMLYDKSFRNAMIQDVLQFKRQLLRLRRILQEDEDCLTRTETLNPFETDNGQLFASCGLDSKLLEDIDLASLTSSTTDDPLQELADLRRQVVYLQGQVDDRDRTIRLQRNLIEKLEAEKGKPTLSKCEGDKEVINMATQTERTRPLSIGPDGLSRRLRSKLENTSYTTYFPVMRSSDSTTIMRQQHNPTTTTNQTRRHTIISTTFTNYNHQQQPQQQQQQQPAAATIAPRRASISWESQTRPTAVVAATTALPTTTYKPVKITLIGEPLQQQKLINTVANTNNNNSNNRLSALTLEQQHKLSNCYNNNNNNNNHSSSFSNMTDEKQHVADNVCRKNGLNNGCGQDKPYQNNNKTNGMHSCQQKQQQQQQQQQYKKYNYNNTINHSNSSSTNTCKPQPTQPTVTIV